MYEGDKDDLPPMNDTHNVVYFPEPELPEGHIWWHVGRKPDCIEYERVLKDKVMVDWNRWDRRRHQSKQFYSHFYTTKHFNLHEKYDYILRMRYDAIFDLNRIEDTMEYFHECLEFDGLRGCQTNEGITEIDEPIDGVVRMIGVHTECVNDQVWTYPSKHFCDEDTIFELFQKNLLPPVEWGLYRLATEHTGPAGSGQVLSSIIPYFKIARTKEWLAIREDRLLKGLTI